MSLNIREVLLRQALSHWGKAAQIGMMYEECGELIAALVHYERGREANVVEEIADVLIMVHQMRLIFGADEVDRAVDMKMARLETVLASTEGH